MKNIRLSKYTTQAANEVRAWIESVSGQRLKAGDLLEALKDGTTLCKLVNMASPSAVRFKESSMPFVQMENISHFLRACQAPPLNLQSHDIFQTVDLYESKDPAQVLQCISAFSRRAHAVQPSRFPTSIGKEGKGGTVSPQKTGGYASASPQYGSRPRGTSNVSETTSTTSSQPSQVANGRMSPTKAFSPYAPSGGAFKHNTGETSSWSKKGDEGATTPAWNIHQYGYMGGASQGNQGITFGGRRQITTPAPKVPSLAEKERIRREKESEAERLRIQAEEAEEEHRKKRLAEEEHARMEEEQRWEEETRRLREQEKRRIEEEKRKWQEEERRWKEEEEQRLREEQEAEARFETERKQRQVTSRKTSEVRPALTGQYLSQYQAEQKQPPSDQDHERSRIQELERQLEEAKAREAQYELERQERQRSPVRSLPTQPRRQSRSKSRNRSAQTPITAAQTDDGAWEEDERSLLQKAWASNHNQPQPSEGLPPRQPPRPLPTPQASTKPRLPSSSKPQSLNNNDFSDRQQEWEESQKATKDAAARGVGQGAELKEGQGAWDVHQYGYLGGDSQNKGATGVGFGMARRQLVGPRERPK
ncbi:MAG: calponin [Ramalina farinacea]|uniref:Calponin n=1 Tax=Ramalina farinacea TaxID=258253 RepID=A0AA43QFE9_9LECA|nr:calponin [Ramalina farinacea]